MKKQLPPDTTLLSVEVDPKANSVTFKVLQPSSPIAWVIVIAIIAAAAAFLAAVGFVIYTWTVYCATTKTYYCYQCRMGPFSYEEYVAHMASAHPEIWAEIKEYVKPPTPPPTIKWEYLVYGAIAVAGVIGIASLIKAMRK
ncbi:MAG: hypothetical protein QXG40_06530 [Ignisphaera sp.]